METQAHIAYDRIEDLKRLQFIDSCIEKLTQKSLSILDVGCGNGNISRYLGAKKPRSVGNRYLKRKH